jgi:subtilisin-like proprotein convertase family protein
LSIPDAGAAVTSSVTIAGCTGNASNATRVEVHITHPYRGDVAIDLVAPDGTNYRLKGTSGGDSADNVDTTYTVNASSEATNGTWQLKVQDKFRSDAGTLDSWKLTV